MSQSLVSKAPSDGIYELFYHPAIPGRGEFIRLLFEATGTPFHDHANAHPPSASGLNGYAIVRAVCNPESTGDEDGNLPVLAPPALRIRGAGRNGKALVIAQTPNILQFVGARLGLAGEDDIAAIQVQQLALTALDLNNETHDTHHPVALSLHYEDQKDESKRRAEEFRERRLPKFLGYFQRVLKHNAADGKGKYLVGKQLSYADTTLWHILDGLKYAFPKEMETRSKEFPLLVETFYEAISAEPNLKAYLASKRRSSFSERGVFRRYPELDRE